MMFVKEKYCIWAVTFRFLCSSSWLLTLAWQTFCKAENTADVTKAQLLRMEGNNGLLFNEAESYERNWDQLH